VYAGAPTLGFDPTGLSFGYLNTLTTPSTYTYYVSSSSANATTNVSAAGSSRITYDNQFNPTSGTFRYVATLSVVSGATLNVKYETSWTITSSTVSDVLTLGTSGTTALSVGNYTFRQALYAADVNGNPVGNMLGQAATYLVYVMRE
jgi:hypothetical protein